MCRISLILFTACLLSACASGPHQPFLNQVDGVRVLSTTSDLEGLVIKDHGGMEKYCASRAIDVADTRSTSLGFGDSVGDSIKGGAGQGAVSLGGMSPAVLIVSELMYRVCELSMNSNLNAEQTIDLYKAFLDAAVTIGGAQTGDGAAGQTALPDVIVPD